MKTEGFSLIEVTLYIGGTILLLSSLYQLAAPSLKRFKEYSETITHQLDYCFAATTIKQKLQTLHSVKRLLPTSSMICWHTKEGKDCAFLCEDSVLFYREGILNYSTKQWITRKNYRLCAHVNHFQVNLRKIKRNYAIICIKFGNDDEVITLHVPVGKL